MAHDHPSFHFPTQKMKFDDKLENLIFKQYEGEAAETDSLKCLDDMPRKSEMPRKSGITATLNPKTAVEDNGYLLNQDSYLPESMVVNEIFAGGVQKGDNSDLEYAFEGVQTLKSNHKSAVLNNRQRSVIRQETDLNLDQQEIYLELGNNEDFQPLDLSTIPADLRRSDNLISTLYIDAGQDSGVEHLELEFEVDTLGWETPPVSQRSAPSSTVVEPSYVQEPLMSLFEQNARTDTSSSLLPAFENDIQQQIYTELANSASINHLELQTLEGGKDITDFKKFLHSIVREIKANPHSSIKNISAKVGDAVVNPFTGKTVGKEFLMKLYSETRSKGGRKTVSSSKQSTKLSEKEKMLIKAVASLFSSSRGQVEESGDLFGPVIPIITLECQSFRDSVYLCEVMSDASFLFFQ